MSPFEKPTAALHGMFRDVMYDAEGRVIWDHGWSKNAIVGDCRLLLAAFTIGTPSALGVQGLWVGIGDPNWDSSGTPTAQSSQRKLVDPSPYSLDYSKLKVNFLVGDVTSPNPTNKVQIVAKLGPGVPPLGGATHITLREFGLYGKLDGNNVLINYVTHPAIAKDSASTLERTIWLVF